MRELVVPVTLEGEEIRLRPPEGLRVDEALLESVRGRAARFKITPRIVVECDRETGLRVSQALRHAFAQERTKVEDELRRTVRAGTIALLVAAAVLVFLEALVEGIQALASASRFLRALQEGLIIIGWVLLWKPAELLIFDQLTLRRDRALWRRLEQAEIVTL